MEKMIDEQLKRELSFDLYGRYAIIRDIINNNRRNGEKFRVLDVGGRGNLLKRFLPNDEVFYLDPLIDSNDKNFIKDDGCAMSLKDESFDWVTSADVFEHIPKEKREAFLSENIRVAKLGTILTAPFWSKEVEQAEINANENYKKFSGGEDHMWLKEHIENGLPEENKIEDFLNNKGFTFQKLYNNRLFLWETLLGIYFLAWNNFNDLVKEDLRDFNYFYNSKVFPYDSMDPSYRKIYFIKKDNNLINLEFKSSIIDSVLFLRVIKKGIDLIAKIDIENKNYIKTKDQEIKIKDKDIQSKIREIEFMKSSKFWKIKTFYEKFKTPVFYIGRLIKKALIVLIRDGFFVFIKKITIKLTQKIRFFINIIYNNFNEKKSDIDPLKSVYYISNVAQGGSKKYILDLIDLFKTPYLDFVQIKNKNDLNKYRNQFKDGDIFLFQYLIYSDLTFDDILNIKKQHNIKLVIPIHDFYFLYNNPDNFVLPNINVHSNYLENRTLLPEVLDFLKAADLIIYPSLFVKNIFDSIFKFPNAVLSKHIDYKISDFLSIPKVEKTINIGIINNITTYKGADYYSNLFSIKNFNGYDIKYHIFGTEKVDVDNVIFHGPYKESEIFSLLKENNIHGLVFLNKWGETYSYSLTKGINSGLPILYSNLGAYIERLQNNPKFFAIHDIQNIEQDMQKMLKMILKKQSSSSNNTIIYLEKDIPDLYRNLFFIDYSSLFSMKISVVIPNYNYENFLTERLNSIINQTYKPFEIIFLDDNSQDNSIKLVEKILGSSNIPYKIIKNTVNKGCFSQWIKGINEAKGDLIWIAEADDFCEQNFLEHLVPKFLEKSTIIAYCQSKRIDENGYEIFSDYLDYTDDISKEKWKHDYVENGISEILNAMCIKNTIPNVSATVFRKIELNPEESSKLLNYKIAGDWFFYLILLQKGDIAYSSRTLNSHRRHSNSIVMSHGVFERFREVVSIQNFIMNNFDISDENRCKLFKYRELVYKNDILFSPKEDKNINICFSCDNKYVHPFAATLASVLKNSSDKDIYNIYILDGGISEDNKKKILTMKNIRDFNLEYITIDKKEFDSCPITDYAPYITIATYYRFKIPSYLKNIDKVLYMDCDMTVNRDIRELFDTNIDNYYVAAVPEVCNQHHKRRLEIEGGHYYFNAGLLLINNKKWREDNIEEKLFDYTRNPRRTIVHVDQDVLNDVLKYKVTYLPLAWNFQHDAIDMNDSYPYHQKERLNALNNPYIIHYTNKYKPWHKECTNKFKDRYYYYLKLTPFNDI